jgi:hypothetical protein
MQRSHQTCVEQLLRRCVFLCLGLSLTACNDDNRVHFEIRNIDDKSAAPLTDMCLIVDDDKYCWPTLSGGETQSTNLWPSPSGEREVVLLYTHAGERRDWVGPKLGRSQQGYRVYVQLGATGVMTSRYCALPCSFDNPTVLSEP